eukprot:GILK01016835.1.p2 GENE.GILK01016835.1~~GILK01016835.1.p2  ORF type:complete len:124 (+),score=18.42 GILK01016835.1:396-767(+)
MSSQRGNPFEELWSLQDRMSRLFDNMWMQDPFLTNRSQAPMLGLEDTKDVNKQGGEMMPFQPLNRRQLMQMNLSETDNGYRLTLKARRKQRTRRSGRHSIASKEAMANTSAASVFPKTQTQIK